MGQIGIGEVFFGMANIGEQIRNARNAKGWTQAALAEKMNVSRSAVANWEQGQRLPDMITLVRLVNVLGCQIGGVSMSQVPLEGAEKLSPEGDLPAGAQAVNMNLESSQANLDKELENKTVSDQSEGHASPTLDDSTSVYSPALAAQNKVQPISGMTRKRIIVITAAALTAITLLVWLVILPTLHPKTKGHPYTSSDGGLYTIERMQQHTENIPGKAYLIVNPSVQINHGETMDYYLFEFTYHEMNGIGLTIDRLELIYFSKKNENAFFIFTAEDIKTQYGISVDIPAYGDWVYTNGLPVQDTVYGVGELLHCTDANGEKLTFTSYIPFPEA